MKVMKLKSNLRIGIVIAYFLLGGITVHAQGIYSTDNNTSSNPVSSSSSTSEGGMFRASGPPGSGDTGDGKDPAPGDGSDEDPIGGGLLILSLFAGTYALIKRKTTNRHED